MVSLVRGHETECGQWSGEQRGARQQELVCDHRGPSVSRTGPGAHISHTHHVYRLGPESLG